MVGGSVSRTRAFSLRAPVANPEERAHFQQRLALTSLAVFLLSGAFWAVTLLSLLIVAPDQTHVMWTSRTNQVQLATTSIGLFVWLLARGRPLEARLLDIVDGASGMAICSGWALMTAFQQSQVRPDLIGLLACTFTLILRSALVPSTPARSALLSSVSLVPLIVLTHVRMSSQPTSSPLTPAVYAGIWALLAVGATTTTTWTIYGLRAQVRKAMQLGQYLLEDKLGEGGMGTVYRASHAMLRRPTAIKLLSKDNAQAVERFEREVQITARLTHPNTIAIYDYGRTPDGVFYYAMEYLEGVSLEDLVEATGPQPVARVAHMLLQICGALREAHDAGLVHRDIKPANIMLTARGGIPDFVKVLDFGLVKETVAPSNASLTQGNTILGTPYYMAPETIIEPDTIDGRADIYALGATAFFLLTGERVFDGNNLVEICGKHLHEQPKAPSAERPDIPKRIDDIVLACLAKKADDRPKDAHALAEMLRGAGIAPWTEADACAWWSAHSRELERPAKANPSMVFGETIAVAMVDRR